MRTNSSSRQDKDKTPAPIVARLVADVARIDCLPRFFGGSCVRVEHAVYTVLDRLCSDYTGGYWDFFTLSNGDFFMAPHADTPLRIACDGNGFEGEVSGIAAGIIACLMALSHLSFVIEDDRLSTLFHLLRDYAMEHPEAGAIFRAID